MNNNKLLAKAIEIAITAHKEQSDKYGAPYIGHITRVMNMGKNTNEQIVGILHDLVEDTAWTFDQLVAEGFSSVIIDAIKCVTKTSDEENYDDYIERIKSDPLAVQVKLHDLADNMDLRRMTEIKQQDMKRLNKYVKAYHYLKNI